ncbi:ubiquinol-cytochrome c reductase iron-sulfur subunit [Ralstonia syzygii subsp. celebesensis]|uniref:Ubiquinol-cytochrome c reductase iron-sulfur subunit n=1 Tax=blood disease bacterium R229 TaxID=741978 RepID=G2ZQR6_9RALS|nr:ubiquinol-cytochrome c reductase iron-sulfur subunit [Ralstonia syzygii]QQV55433.1 ubiquinol-cytochrome c reductase iron-sulfur subunit [Ralstonia syzygii subsp. celebesensis]CCA81379.1 cytochrome bC1 complex (ubiquinol:ferricytochrome c oxidoreductase), Rieske iron-sulfur subunit [blood disease bacterium R229]
MSDQQNVDKGRRNLLIATSVAGGVGGVAVAAPFVCTFAPSEKARAAGAPVEADVSDLAPGQMKVVEWRGKPVWLLKRTPEMLASLKKTDTEIADPKSDVPFTMKTPDYCKNETRSRAEHQDLLVVVGICSHLGCSPSGPFVSGANVQLGADPGFVCPCHGSTFDLAGRVFKNKPAPQNLDVPPYMFLSDTKLLIGKDEKGEA